MEHKFKVGDRVRITKTKIDSKAFYMVRFRALVRT